MGETIDPTGFSVNERQREFVARVRVVGYLDVPIEADDRAAAMEKAEAAVGEIEAGTLADAFDDIDEVDICHLSKCRPLFRVIRAGQIMQVTSLRPGDEPREPNDRGF